MDIDGIKISELTRIDSVGDNDDFVVNSSGVTHKTRFSVIKGNIVQYVNGFIDAVNQALVGEVSNRTQADNQLSSRIDNEVTARQSADSALGGRIDAEVSARGLADVELGSRISSESTARQSADSALSSRIDAEVSARQSADSELRNTLISKDVGAPFADQPAITLDNCTGTLTNELYYKVVGDMLAIYGRFRITNAVRTSSSPGVKLSLPSGYQITTPANANHSIFVGSSFYSDSVRNGEATYIQLINGSHDYFYIRASESFANVINNKNLIYIIPYTLLKLSNT